MERADAWMGCADEWLERDLRLLTAADGFRSVLARRDLRISRRKSDDDPNDLFRVRAFFRNGGPAELRTSAPAHLELMGSRAASAE